MANPALLAKTTGEESWQQQLRDVITSPQELCQLLQISPADNAATALAQFPLRLPRAYARRIKPGDSNDPLLLQVLAQAVEMEASPGYGTDPLSESGSNNPAKGLIQKYRNRALLIVTSACAIHCRYCFRRHFPYEDQQNSRTDWRQTLDHIRGDTTIDEVILSGGDPLVTNDQHLQFLIEEIAAIDHIKRLRIHSRMPVVIPARITEQLLENLQQTRLSTVLVIHANHANELDEDVAAALQRCAEAGITLLNQAVLLAGVNDSAAAQVDLNLRLFDCGVLPYYLHLLDPVQGAAHFHVSEASARKLMAQISGELPGYLVPRLAREQVGENSKTVIAPDY